MLPKLNLCADTRVREHVFVCVCMYVCVCVGKYVNAGVCLCARVVYMCARAWACNCVCVGTRGVR